MVRYGDHQPSATRDIINDVWGDDSPDVGTDGSPGPFITFYAMQGSNLAVPPLPAYDPLDIAYVGTVMLEAAGLPLSAAQQERKRLMVACEGRYFGCRAAQPNSGLPPPPHKFGLRAGAINTAGLAPQAPLASFAVVWTCSPTTSS